MKGPRRAGRWIWWLGAVRLVCRAKQLARKIPSNRSDRLWPRGRRAGGARRAVRRNWIAITTWRTSPS